MELKASKNKLPYWLVGDLPEFDKDFLTLFKKFQKERGDYVILNAPLGFKFYTFFHPDAVEHILSNAQENFPRMNHFTQACATFMGRGLLTTEGKERNKIKTLLNPSFSPKNLIPFFDWMASETQKFSQSLVKKGQVNIYPLISAFTFKLTMGLIFGPENIGYDKKFEGLIERALLELTKRIQAPFNFPTFIPTPKNLNALKIRSEINKAVEEMILNCKQSQYPTQLNFLRNQTEPKFTLEEIRDQIIPLLLVGNDTFAISLVWTWYSLGQNPEVYLKMKQEVCSILKSDRVTPDDLTKLEYTNMVYSEAMRLYPPAYAISRQNLKADEIKGIKLKKNSIIILSQYVVHRHKDFWERPDEFYPEHFTAERVSKRHRYSYFPFGAGKRICIGNIFSKTIGPLILATLVKDHQVKLAPNQDDNYDLSFSLRPKNGMYSIFE